MIPDFLLIHESIADSRFSPSLLEFLDNLKSLERKVNGKQSEL